VGKLSHALRQRATVLGNACFATDIVWLCVPDSQIVPVARSLQSVTNWKAKVVFHSSGALTSDVLQVLPADGASVAFVHSLMTFVHHSQPELRGVPFGIEGDRVAVRVAQRIIQELGGDVFIVRKQDKALYHAWGTMLSPLLLSFMVTAEQVARATGIS